MHQAQVIGRVIVIRLPIVVRELAAQLKQKPFRIINDLMEFGVFASVNQAIDETIARRLCAKYGFRVEIEKHERAEGNVIESGLEPGGPTATVLVRKGTLRVGDIVLCGQFYGKVRALLDLEGNRQNEAGPSVVVKIFGLNGVPEVGLEFRVVENEKEAREEVGKREVD